ncbi:MAG: NAD(P)H-dependent oxidoreductase subunit E [Trueperaceae bacterium]|nr:NAD(P)H-dependent oxidoreductase subunit E [Trueperaceae bacterium]
MSAQLELPTVAPFFADKPDLLVEILGRYPDYGRRSALMPLLWEVQRAERHVGEARIAEIADILGLRATEVKGVMSFYSTYHEHPVGAYHLQICATLSCSLAGADELYDYLSEETGVVNGETDREGRFSIQKVECLGSCGSAPVLQINDDYYERVTRSRCAALLEAMRADRLEAPWRERSGDTDVADPVAARADGSPSGTGGAP